MKKFYLFLAFLVFAATVFFLFKTYLINVDLGVLEESDDKSGDVKKISFIHWGEFPKEVFSRFSEKYPNLSVKDERFDEDYYPVLQKIRIASGNEVDVMGIMTNDYDDFVRRGYLLDLSERDYLSNYMTEVRDAVKANQNNKKEYAVAYKSRTFGIWYNKILFNKYNIEVPEDYNEFLKVCRKLDANGVSPLIAGARDEWAGSYICLLRIQNILDKDKNWFRNLKTGKTKWSDTEMESAFKDLSTFIENGYLREDSILLTYHQAFSQFTKGRAAMIIMDDSSLNLVKEGMEKVCDPGVIAIAYNAPHTSVKVAGIKGDYLTGIFSESKNKVQADLLLGFLSTTEAAQLYSNETMSVSTVKGVDISGLKFNKLWEPLRKTETISPGITELDHEMLQELNKGVKQMIAKTKTYQQVISELNTKQNELYTKESK